MVTVARYKVHRPECKAGSLPLNYPSPHDLGQLQLCKYSNISVLTKFDSESLKVLMVKLFDSA